MTGDLEGIHGEPGKPPYPHELNPLPNSSTDTKQKNTLLLKTRLSKIDKIFGSNRAKHGTLRRLFDGEF